MIPYIVIWLGLLSSSIAGLSVTPRAFLGCSLVLDNIYCYGGLTGSSQVGVFNSPTADHIILNLQNFNYQNLTMAAQSWALNNGATGANLLIANGYQLTSGISGNSKFLVYGGYGLGGNTILTNPLLVYDPPTNTWSSLPTYNNSQYTVIGAITDIPSQQSLWTWGGNALGGVLNNTQLHAPNVANIYKYGTNQWSQAAGDTANTNVRFSYTATLGTNNRIYIIGGFEAPSGVNYQSGPVSMMLVRWFDTTSGAWGTDNATVTGDTQAVMPRAYHTTTPVPGSTSFIVYGGSTYIASQNTIPADYAYLYDYNAKQYTSLNLGTNGAGRRSAHCAVPYKNYIFYMFGFDDLLQLRNDINVLDVSNATNPVWVTPSQAQPSGGSGGSGSNSNSTSADSGSTPNGSSGGLSTGATAGIAVAAVVVGLGLIIGGVFLFYRRRKQQKLEEVTQMDPRAMLKAYDAHDEYTAVASNSEPSKENAARPTSPYQLQEIIKPSSDQRDPTSKPFSDELP